MGKTGKEIKMQLKRDTDYALRLLLCALKKREQGEKGASLTDLCRCSCVPHAVAARLCRRLVEAELLEESGREKRFLYSIRQEALDKTMLDVVQAVEGDNGLFAIFDHSTQLYECCKEYFAAAEQKVEEGLQQISLQQLADKTLVQYTCC